MGIETFMNLILERALFVVAPPDSGKSTQLRSMFLDRRLGTEGNVPADRKIPDCYYISNERRLHLRLTSPHEYNETPEEYMRKAKAKMGSGRWCFACAFQPDAHSKMPDVVQSVRSFIAAFEPERVRVAFLSPNRHGQELKDFVPGRDLSDELLQIAGVEVACVDARRRQANGLFLADFFDFT
jgi:hypothetical protein